MDAKNSSSPNEINNFEEDEQPTFCNMCQELPEEYIALSCSHNFCLVCLTKSCLQSNNNKLIRIEKSKEEGKLDDEEYQILCPIDEQPTPLNNSSIEALNKMRDSVLNGDIKKKPVYNEVIFEESAENFHTTDEFPKKKSQRAMNTNLNHKPNQKENYISNSSPLSEEKFHYLDKNFNSAKELPNYVYNSPQSLKKREAKSFNHSPSFCSIHKQEELMVICFSCENRLLCVECIVSGNHKNHEMANISKIKENCKDALDHIFPEIDKKKGEFKFIIEKLVSDKKIVSDKIWEIKAKITQDFNELKERLANKENELLLAKDFEASEKFSEIDVQIQDFQEKINKLEEFQNSLTLKFKTSETFSDGIDLLNYFNGNKDEVFNIFSSQISKFSLEIENLNLDIDKKSFINYLECIHNLNLATTNLEKVDDKNKVTSNLVKSNSFQKIKIEKSLLITEPIKEKSPILNENDYKSLLLRSKEKVNKFFDVQSPFKNSNLLNTSSFNNSLYNEKSRPKDLKWITKSFSKSKDGINSRKYNFNMSSFNTYFKNYESNIKKPNQKTSPFPLRLLNVQQALEKQNETFKKRKNFFIFKS